MGTTILSGVSDEAEVGAAQQNLGAGVGAGRRTRVVTRAACTCRC